MLQVGRGGGLGGMRAASCLNSLWRSHGISKLGKFILAESCSKTLLPAPGTRQASVQEAPHAATFQQDSASQEGVCGVPEWIPLSMDEGVNTERAPCPMPLSQIKISRAKTG